MNEHILTKPLTMFSLTLSG